MYNYKKRERDCRSGWCTPYNITVDNTIYGHFQTTPTVEKPQRNVNKNSF